MTEIANRKRGMYYLDDGRIYPSVTTILGVIAKPGLIPWAAKTAAQAARDNPEMDVDEAAAAYHRVGKSAADRGTEVHRIIQDGITEIPEELKGYINAYNKWAEKEEIKVIAREMTVYSDTNEYAGTADLTCVDKHEKKWIVDIKTGGVYREHFLQLEAYRIALEEMGQEGPWNRGILKLNPDGTYAFLTEMEDLAVFLAAKMIWEWTRKGEV